MPVLKKLTPEDVLTFQNVTDAQISWDGSQVAFVIGDQFIVSTKLPKSNIWSVPTTGGEPQRLTTGTRADTTPRWSPDGETLAFLSDRIEDGQRQIYLLPRGSAEATRLTDIEGIIPTPRGLNPISWAPDGRTIAFLKTDPEDEDRRRRKREKDDAIEFEKSLEYTRLYLADVETGVVSSASPEGLQIWEFCWSPSGQEFAAVASDLPFEQSWYTCRLTKFSVNGSSESMLHQDSRQIAKPVWSPDGSTVAFISSNWSDRGVVAGGIFLIPYTGGQARELSVGHVASTSWLEWSRDSLRLLTVAHERGETGISEVEVDSGARRSLWRGAAVFAESNWPQFSSDSEGTLAIVSEDGGSPRNVCISRSQAGGLGWKRLTNLHPQADHLSVGTLESIHWKGADGWNMQGLLIRPAGMSAQHELPMVTVVHGGPTSVHTHQYYPARHWNQLIAAEGIVVFLPNPRGSTGWGLEFAEANLGDMGGKDWEDIQRGIDHCVEQRIADPNRLGIAGWSYGGFMAAWAVTQTERFKAAMMGAGIADWRSFHGRSCLCDWDKIHYGGADPWDPEGPFRNFSPITHVKQARTPTLILHGEEDRDVPVEQSYLFYRALRDLGIETELVVYPREAHGLQERNHLLDISRRIPEWFVNHLSP